MLNELLNTKVRVRYTTLTHNAFLSEVEGIVVAVDDNFIRLDIGLIIAIKYIVTVKPL